MDDEFSVELDRFRVVHAPTGCVYSFPEKVGATALDLWQVVEVGTVAGAAQIAGGVDGGGQQLGEGPS